MSFEAHPANTTIEHLEILYKHGFRRMSLGIQDFDPQVMKLINRKQSVEQVKAITNVARIIGYNSVNFDLIYGLPAQTLQSIERTINEVMDMRPDRIALYGYAHVPKMKPAQSSFEQFLPNGDERTQLCEFSRELLVKAGYVEIGLDHYALPDDELLIAARSGNLHRNFMGYTTKSGPLLIGLGPSAISDAHTMFAQNASKLEDWNNFIDHNDWPGIKGHQMTSEDMILRKHILNIMCGFETNWLGDITGCPFLEGVHERLILFEHQGLVQLSRGAVKVLPKGKKYLRHIGLCFDSRFHQKNSAQTVLSNAS